MDEIVAKFLQMVADRWHTRTGLLLGMLTAAVFTIALLALLRQVEMTPEHWGYAFVAVLLILLSWVHTNQLPVAPKKHIGFVVAITSEDETYARRLRDDFVQELRTLLQTSELKYQFALLEYAPRISEKIEDFPSAKAFMRRSRAHFMVFGRARTRRVGGQESHYLTLEGLVLHKELPDPVQRALGEEFAAVFPRKVIFPRENDIFSFTLTSEWLDAVARYIVGIAAMLSGDFEYAEGLLLSVRTRTSGAVAHLAQVARIRNQLPQRLAQLYTIWLDALYQAYYMSRDKSHLERAEALLDKRERIDPGNYSQHLFRAICCFVLRRDVRGARREIRACRGIRDATWRYSEAFLHAYEGSLSNARRSYQIAMRGVVGPTVPVQTEEFIQLVLAEEPDRYQLYFCTGLLNLEVKQDYASARRDFELFLANAREGAYPDEVELAREYIVRCDQQLQATEEAP